MLRRILFFSSLVLSIVLSVSSPQNALRAEEAKPKQQMFITSDIVMLNEIGAIIIPKNNLLIVDMVSPSDQRPKEYQLVDLKKDDEVLMINGKKAAALSDLQAAYDALAFGADVKLGVRRGKDMMIVSFPKADPSKLPQRKVMSITTEGGGNGMAGGAGMMKFSSAEGEIAIIQELGLIISEDSTGLKIVGVMDSSLDAVKQAGIKDGDIVVALQDNKVTTVKDLLDQYQKIDKDQSFTVSVEHGGKVAKVTAKKGASTGQPKMFKSTKTE